MARPVENCHVPFSYTCVQTHPDATQAAYNTMSTKMWEATLYLPYSMAMFTPPPILILTFV